MCGSGDGGLVKQLSALTHPASWTFTNFLPQCLRKTWLAKRFQPLSSRCARPSRTLTLTMRGKGNGRHAHFTR